jgi:lipopolysaccharide export LptBFGC system permease protein LptF
MNIGILLLIAHALLVMVIGRAGKLQPWQIIVACFVPGSILIVLGAWIYHKRRELKYGSPSNKNQILP